MRIGEYVADLGMESEDDQKPAQAAHELSDAWSQGQLGAVQVKLESMA